MEGPRNSSRFPIISYARVIGYDPINHGVFVDIPSQQAISVPAKVLYNGPADATRIEQLPLPIIGTWGLIAVPFGDTTSVIWLGAFYMSSVNAITTSQFPILEDGQIHYMSHASGTYSILDYYGNYFYRSPDGTIILLNQDNMEPITYRNIVDSETGQQKLIPFTDADRNPTPPNPVYVSVQHPTGTSETITPSGIISKKTGPGGTDTPTAGPILELNPLSSNATAPQGTPAGGLQLIGQAGNSSIYMDKDGNIVVTSNGSITSILLTSSGDVTINAQTDVDINAQGNVNVDSANDIFLKSDTTGIIPLGPGIMSVNDLIDKINNHQHTIYNVQAGSDTLETAKPDPAYWLP